MGLIPWRNKHEVPVRRELAEQPSSLAQFRREMDSLLEDFFKTPWSLFDSGSERSGFSSWIPSLDLNENGEGVEIALEIPGIDLENIDISVSGSMLTIQGEKKEEKEDRGKDYYHSERSFGTFRRVVDLPSNTDVDSIQASYDRGVLKLTARKAGDSTRKRIPILKR